VVVLSLRAKTHNYLNLILADKEVKAAQPQAWSVLLDENGNLCEGIGSNIFVVRDERIYTPQGPLVTHAQATCPILAPFHSVRPVAIGSEPMTTAA
jgi:hypothetical protein